MEAEVTGISRNTDKISSKNKLLKTHDVDVNTTAALGEVLKGNEVLINAFNSGLEQYEYFSGLS